MRLFFLLIHLSPFEFLNTQDTLFLGTRLEKKVHPDRKRDKLKIGSAANVWGVLSSYFQYWSIRNSRILSYIGHFCLVRSLAILTECRFSVGWSLTRTAQVVYSLYNESFPISWTALYGQIGWEAWSGDLTSMNFSCWILWMVNYIDLLSLTWCRWNEE